MLLHDRGRQTVLLEPMRSGPTRVYSKAERDIVRRSFHNQRVRTLTEPALNTSRSDIARRYGQMRDTTRVHERALFVAPRMPSEL